MHSFYNLKLLGTASCSVAGQLLSEMSRSARRQVAAVVRA
jgi:hypothetical protein